ncbi:MAG: reprolysin-like metallopeptidase [Algibacter sp.]
MKTKLHYVLSTTMLLVAFSSFAQKSSWKKLENIQNSDKIHQLHLDKNKTQFYELDANSLKQKIAKATSKNELNKNSHTVIEIPNLNGDLESFEVYETSVFSPELAAKYPNIKSFTGMSTDGKGSRLRMSTSPSGIQTMISYVDKPHVFMQQTSRGSNQYLLYDNNAKQNISKTFTCETVDAFNDTFNKSNALKIDEGGANNQTLQTFRIAISVTGEYTAYFGGTVAGALAGINATLTRVNDIFETDMAVTFELIDATQLIYTNAATDPYSDVDDLDNWNSELQNNLTATIGNGSYDVGHLFGASGGGGDAGCIGCVCTDNLKGSAYTSPSNGIPEGDTFDLNYVIHEIGHQMGANHTWAFESEGTSVQSEPGSGSTIMAYAGITDEDDIQLNSDPYFHYHSIKQVLDNLTTKTCQTTSSISNTPPETDAGLDYTIPLGTPYVLKGSATDENTNDVLTYCWEQIDNGIVNSANYSATRASGSLNRSLPPSVSPDRFIPNIKNVINGQLTESNPGIGSSWESVSTTARSLNWALTVRDRNPTTILDNGQTSYDTMVISVDNTSGPFVVTSQNISNVDWTPGDSESITWDVANTDSAPTNTSHVNILLSIDGGLTFPTTLITNTPNDGSQDINVPLVSAPFCRIKIEAVDNIYYAINSEPFAINYTIDTTCPSTYASASNLNVDITDGSEATHTINVPDSGILSSVKVTIDVEHTYIDDLVIKITHPNGSTSSKVWNKNCSDENDLVISFEDWADNVNCTATEAGNTYAPAELLDIFNGLDMAGNWEISLTDLGNGDIGVLNSWSLDLCSQTTTLTNPDLEEPEDIVGVKVFPNPNNGRFTVAFESGSGIGIQIIICDVRGRIVFNKTYSDIERFNQEIHLNNTLSGMYVLTITDGILYTKKKVIIN